MFGAQQPAQGGSAFGSTAPVFGAQNTGATGGGLFGGGGNATGGFGAPSGGGLFGAAQNKPATGFGASPQGAFGSTPIGGGSLFGGGTSSLGGGFGSTMNAGGGLGMNSGAGGLGTGGGFGAAATPAFRGLQPTGGGAFGASSSVFGSQANPTPFGTAQSASAFGSSPFGQAAGGAKGTTGTKYQATTEYDAKEGTSLKYQSISLMPAYKGKSVEELRVEDYLQGVKRGPGEGAAGTAPPATGGGLFGSTPAQPSGGGLFGSQPQSTGTLAWNAQAPSASQSAFGAPSTFGVPASGGLGGGAGGMSTSNQSTGGGLFGKPANPAFSTPAASGSLFGSTPLSTGTFGQSTPALGGGGLFGNTQNATPTFGVPATTQPSPFGGGLTGGGLGTTAPATSINPLTGTSFGQQSTSAFGIGNAAAKPATQAFSTAAFSKPGQFGSGFSGGLFSSQNTTPGAQPTPTLGLNTTPLSNPGSSLFNSTPAPTQQAPLQATINATPFGSSPLFSTPVASAQIPPTGTQGQGGVMNAGLQGSNSPAPPYVPTTSPSVYRRTPRSSAKVRPRSYMSKNGGLGSGTSVSSLFGSSSAAPVFSATSFLGGNDSTPWKSPQRGSEDRVGSVKKLVIEEVGETPSKHVSRTLSMGDGGNSEGTTPRKPSQPEADREIISNGVLASVARKSSLTPTTNGTTQDDSDLDTQSVDPSRKTTAHAKMQTNGFSSRKKESREKAYAEPSQRTEQAGPFLDGLENGGAVVSNGLKSAEDSDVPILTKKDYYTKPSMDTLRSMSIDELEAVEDFTLGRIDVGEVTWIGPTNVRGLDLDKIVQLEPREVIVYPDEEEKPEVGQSLNKPAEIRLERVWRNDKQTGKPLKDPKSVQNFIKRLQSHCKKEELTFLGYEPVNGTWSFLAQHFSRYGFEED